MAANDGFNLDLITAKDSPRSVGNKGVFWGIAFATLDPTGCCFDEGWNVRSTLLSMRVDCNVRSGLLGHNFNGIPIQSSLNVQRTLPQSKILRESRRAKFTIIARKKKW